jgi:hypothetical protein
MTEDKAASLLRRVLESFVNGRKVKEGIDLTLREECDRYFAIKGK